MLMTISILHNIIHERPNNKTAGSNPRRGAKITEPRTRLFFVYTRQATPSPAALCYHICMTKDTIIIPGGIDEYIALHSDEAQAKLREIELAIEVVSHGAIPTVSYLDANALCSGEILLLQ